MKLYFICAHCNVKIFLQYVTREVDHNIPSIVAIQQPCFSPFAQKVNWAWDHNRNISRTRDRHLTRPRTCTSAKERLLPRHHTCTVVLGSARSITDKDVRYCKHCGFPHKLCGEFANSPRTTTDNCRSARTHSPSNSIVSLPLAIHPWALSTQSLASDLARGGVGTANPNLQATSPPEMREQCLRW